MRAALALLLCVAGATTTGAAVLRSNGRVRPASPWSLTERLAALRVERALPSSVRKQASLSLQEGRAVLKVREASGPVLLKCPPGADLAQAFAGWARDGTPAGCEAQAADEVGDVLVYEVSGRVSPLCPGQTTSLTEQQLHNALYLPALQLASEGGRRRGESALGRGGGGVLERGTLADCAPGGANCALARSAGALLYCGVLRTCAAGPCFQGDVEIQPDDVATSLYYAQTLGQARTPSRAATAACGPVPMSAHLSGLVGEAVTRTTAAAFAQAQPWSAAALASSGSAGTAADLRAFFEHHPRGLCLLVRGVDLDRPREAEMAAQSLAFPVFAPFDPRLRSRATPLLAPLQKAASDDAGLAALLGCELDGAEACKLRRARVSAQLRASLGALQPALGNLAADELPVHIGASGPFHLADWDPLHVTLESSALVEKTKGARSHLLVGYQPLWPESLPEKRRACLQQPGICLFRALWRMEGAAPPDDGIESLVALFARRGVNTRCVRRLFDALAGSGDAALLELQRSLREPVGAEAVRGPCDPRARGVLGLVPGPPSASCGEIAQRPFGSLDEGGCRAVSLVYVQEEPWAGAAARIAAIAAASQVTVSVSGVKASEVHRGPLGSWDVLLTVASNYYNRRFPTLLPLLDPAGSQNLSGGPAISDDQGPRLLAGYEASIVFPAPGWLGPAGSAPPTREASLLRLEEDVARSGPAPIYPLAFLRPSTVTVPEAQADAAQSPWYFARLLEGWSGQP